MRNRHRLDTILATTGRDPGFAQGAVNVPVLRASTRLYDSVSEYQASRGEKFGNFRYGRYGTPTTFALEQAIAELEGGYRSITYPSGQGAIASVLRALLRPGDHLLMVDNVYGPARDYCLSALRARGIEITFYPPSAGKEIAGLLRERTRVVYCESPGSLTFEIQDIPAVAAAAREHGAVVVADNTWATPYFFRPFDHGVDVSIHAATKYIVGHSDAMLGLVVTGEKLFPALRAAAAEDGIVAAPDDCWLALRGLRTLGVRLRQHQSGALRVAEWLRAQPQVAKVRHPALAGDPGHALWKRDFLGSSGLFGVELAPVPDAAVNRFIDSLELFGIGSSWGGFESLILPSKPVRTTEWEQPSGPMLRIHVGLEDPDDLIADLSAAMIHLGTAESGRSATGDDQ